MKNWRYLLQQKPWLLPALGLAAALLLAAFVQASSSGPASTTDFEIDTYIPQGYVLVPITVQNSESVDSMFGSYGMVDLYALNENGRAQNHPLLRSVKMLRAPRNPQLFGILVPEEGAAHVMRAGSAFAVVVLNRSERGTVFEKSTRKVRRQIIIEGDET
jgi:hypothetical protein